MKNSHRQRAIKFVYTRNDIEDTDRALSLEWIETNGLGGWASSTILGVNTRRYHGLLVSALQPPVGRAVLVSRMDETIIQDGRTCPLQCCEFESGALAPHNGVYLHHFEKELFPIAEYRAEGFRLKKTIAACHGLDAVVVLYELLQADTPVNLELTPLFAGRDYHYERRADDRATMDFVFTDGQLNVRCGPGHTQAYIYAPGMAFTKKPAWIRGIKHRVETYRGLGDMEDLYRCGVLAMELNEGDQLGIVLSGTPLPDADARALFEAEEVRRKALIADCADSLDATLVLAADQFIVARGENLQTIVAGYHWFTDWGRDTMIALPGLCLATGRTDTAKRIIQAFADYISEGMIPNRFPDAGASPEYNTIDATLWMFVAIYDYVRHTNDIDALRAWFPKLRDSIEWHKHGTRYGIHVCEDELLAGGEPGTQLTWMDAKVGDWVVTPRQGKAVEINALWYNVLMIMTEFAETCEPEACAIFRRMAERVKEAFAREFWNPEQQCLFDCIDGKRKDPTIRPNQVFAISLPHPLLEKDKNLHILRVIEEKLATPVGLRSAAPDSEQYHGWYGGDQVSRDGAYHQGAVWSWLAGPYISALYKTYEKAEAASKSHALINGLTRHLAEAGIGSISEIFDGDPPHNPRGCIAQAWGVGEFLRVMREYRD
ncbi:MAG: glycogen debranching protein [Spartobacteria bacterium]|nr:glycogen debranching protein [Spartobacteria bacterium]